MHIPVGGALCLSIKPPGAFEEEGRLSEQQGNFLYSVTVEETKGKKTLFLTFGLTGFLFCKTTNLNINSYGENVLGYFPNLGSLRYGNEYCKYEKIHFFPFTEAFFNHVVITACDWSM